MARVLNQCEKENCGNAGVRERRKYSESDTDQYIRVMLDQLPPSKQLLQRYREKLDQYEKDGHELMAQLQKTATIVDNTARLEKEINIKNAIIDKLRNDIDRLTQEVRKLETDNIRVSSENDRIRLVQGGGKRQVSDPRGRPGSSTVRGTESRDVQDDVIKYLEDQILAQEKAHKEHLKQAKDERSLIENSLRVELEEERLKVGHLQSSVHSLEKQVERLTRDLVVERNGHRGQERKWLEEKAELHRRVQVLEKMTGRCNLKTASSNVDLRTFDERAQKSLIKRLDKQVKEQEVTIEKLRSELRESNDDRLHLNEQVTSLGDRLQSKIEHLTQQLTVSNGRNEKLEKRRHQETEGYKTDIKMLREKISRLEERIVNIVSVREKDEENKKMVNELKNELKARKMEEAKQSPVWIN